MGIDNADHCQVRRSFCCCSDRLVPTPRPCRVLCESAPRLIPSAVDCAVTYVNSPYEPQRVMACSFFAAVRERFEDAEFRTG